MTEPDTTPTPTPNTTPPGPTGPTGGNLDALAAALDAAKTTGGTDATKALLESVGFDTTDDLTKFVQAQREAADAAKTAEEKRAEELAAREAAAEAAQATAKATIDHTTIMAALLRAGVAPDAADKLVPVVQIEGDVTADTATAAVETLRADDTWAPLFGQTAKGAPSGVTPAANKPTHTPASADQADADFERLFPQLAAAESALTTK